MYGPRRVCARLCTDCSMSVRVRVRAGVCVCAFLFYVGVRIRAGVCLCPFVYGLVCVCVCTRVCVCSGNVASYTFRISKLRMFS